MNQFFSNTLKKLRTEKGLSQQELADKLYVTNATVSRWESGNRLPDAMMIYRLAKVLNTNVELLFSAAERDEVPNVIMVDDRKLILTGGLATLEKVLRRYWCICSSPSM